VHDQNHCSGTRCKPQKRRAAVRGLVILDEVVATKTRRNFLYYFLGLSSSLEHSLRLKRPSHLPWLPAPEEHRISMSYAHNARSKSKLVVRVDIRPAGCGRTWDARLPRVDSVMGGDDDSGEPPFSSNRECAPPSSAFLIPTISNASRTSLCRVRAG